MDFKALHYSYRMEEEENFTKICSVCICAATNVDHFSLFVF